MECHHREQQKTQVREYYGQCHELLHGLLTVLVNNQPADTNRGLAEVTTLPFPKPAQGVVLKKCSFQALAKSDSDNTKADWGHGAEPREFAESIKSYLEKNSSAIEDILVELSKKQPEDPRKFLTELLQARLS